jgi:hypothetical protein
MDDDTLERFPRGDIRNAHAMTRWIEGARRARELYDEGVRARARQALGHEPTQDEVDAWLAGLIARGELP